MEKAQSRSLLKKNQAVTVVTAQSTSFTQPDQVRLEPIRIIPMQNSGFQAQQNTSFSNQAATIYPPFQSSVRPQNFTIGPPIYQPSTGVQNSGSLQIIPIQHQQTNPVTSFHLVTDQTRYIPSNGESNQTYKFVQQPVQSVSTVQLPTATSSNFVMTPTPQLQQVLQIQPTKMQNGRIILNCEQKQQDTDSVSITY
jgi:hypothetical protein